MEIPTVRSERNTESSSSLSRKPIPTAVPDADNGTPLSLPRDDDDDDDTARQDGVLYIIGIRHGHSVANAWMTGSNAWGSPTFCDDGSCIDASLSPLGIQQCHQLADRLLMRCVHRDDHVLTTTTTTMTIPAATDDKQTANRSNTGSLSLLCLSCWMSRIDTVWVSPLSRCLQTWELAIRPVLQHNHQQQQQYKQQHAQIKSTTTMTTDHNRDPHDVPQQRIMPTTAVVPLLTERVYTSSDIGQTWSRIQKTRAGLQNDSFNDLDWNWMQQHLIMMATSTTIPPLREVNDDNDGDRTKHTTITTTTRTESSMWQDLPWWYTTGFDQYHSTTTQQQPNDCTMMMSKSAKLNPLLLKGNDNNNDDKNDKEWRPHGQGQVYAVPGEPFHVFEHRMLHLENALRDAYHKQHHRCIVLVTHWGVLRSLRQRHSSLLDCSQQSQFTSDTSSKELLGGSSSSSSHNQQQQQQHNIDAVDDFHVDNCGVCLIKMIIQQK